MTRTGDAGTGQRPRSRLRRFGRILRRIVITIVGFAVCVIGIVLLPLPGPGWLVIFAGLGILSTEYAWAARLLRWVRDFAVRWKNWVKRQHVSVRILLAVLGIAIVGALVYAGYLYER